MATSILTGTARGHRADRPRAGEIQSVMDITPSPYFHWKRGIDCLLAILLLVPALPLMGLLVLLVRLTSRGPGVYAQVRVGKNGRTFTMYKIRSMRQDAEIRTGAVWAQAHDPRVTLVGRILRKLHLDELPQLFNILKGEMSLVGPRPERPEFVRLLARKIPGYSNRLAVVPGITGLAQVNIPPDSDLESVRRKVFLDLEYIRNAGLLMDLRLLVCTAGRLAKVFEPLLLCMLGLYREVPEFGCDRKAAGAPVAPCHSAVPSLHTAGALSSGLACTMAIVQAGEAARSEA